MAKQISQKQIEKIIEKLVSKIDQANIYFLMSIGSSIKKIRALTPTQAQQLVQILKFGGAYEDIIRQIAEYTKMSIDDIDEIFSIYAENDLNFAEKFYKYRNIPFVPFEQNVALKRQTMALANIVKNEMYNFTRTNVLGYTIRDTKGNPQFYGLRETYNRVLDEALLNVGQGKESFDSAMTRIMQDIGGSGLKTLDYKSGRSIRLDSMARTHLNDGLRELHNENQKLLGEEFGADGVEISVHSNPAPDHELVQGRIFSNEEFEKLNNGFDAKDYKGNTYTLDHDHKNGYRPISQMNCYHYIFSVILGVSEPEYTNSQLNEIIIENENGFYLYNKKIDDYKHYTKYEGEQLQRNLERAIRKQKDTQILAKASGNEELLYKSQDKIRILTNKYKQLNEASGLPSRANRLRVTGYKRVAKKK